MELQEINAEKIFTLISNTHSETRFSVNLQESDIDLLIGIDSVVEVVYNQQTKIVEIIHDPTTLLQLLKEIKRKLPQAVFYKKPNSLVEDITPSSMIINNLTTKADDMIRNLTKSNANTQDLVFMSTLAMAGVELVRNPVMPKWYDWLRFSQSAYSHIQLKQEIKYAEEEIKIVDEEIHSKIQSVTPITVEDIKKLTIAIEELKQLVEKKSGEDESR